MGYPVHRAGNGRCSKGISESHGLPGAKIIFAMEYQDKGPPLCKFSKYLVVIKIMDIRHRICHIYYENADFESIFSQKDSLYCCYMCAKFSSTCKIIFIFSCILSSVLWDNFLWMTLYLYSGFYVPYQFLCEVPYSANSAPLPHYDSKLVEIKVLITGHSLIRSFVCSLAHSLTPEPVGQ